MNRILLILTIFSFGYVFNDILEEYNLNVIDHAQAEVDGMSWRALKRDRDFKKAVRSVVSGSCYVENGYVYC